MKRLFFILLICLSSLFAISIKDDYNDFNIDSSPERIVALDYISVNLLIELGVYDRIVGITEDYKSYLGEDYLNFGYDFSKLSSVGKNSSVNYESIAKLKPDIVIVSKKYTQTIEKLRQIGYKVLVTSFKSDNEDFEKELYQGISTMSLLTQTESKAKELLKFIKKCKDITNSRLSKIDSKNRPKVMTLDKWLGSYGNNTYVAEFFQKAGADFITKDDFSGYREFSEESILKYNPDFIFIQSRYKDTKEILENNKILSGLPAIKNNNIIVLPFYAKAWGHITPEAASIGELFIAKKINPKYFEDVNLEEYVNEFYDKFFFHK